jgi:predicted dinucleotide-binding enzyme
MSIGIIGAGAIGTAIARKLAKAGLKASIANSRGPETLQDLVRELGPNITATTAAQAAASDMVFLAVNWEKVEGALANLGPWNGRILIDANNAVQVPSYQPVDLGGRASTYAVAQWAPGARVVKAFNHLIANALEADPKTDGGRRVLFVAGEEVEAKAAVADLAGKLGYAAIDLGGLEQSRLVQFPGGPLAIINLVKLDQ